MVNRFGLERITVIIKIFLWLRRCPCDGVRWGERFFVEAIMKTMAILLLKRMRMISSMNVLHLQQQTPAASTAPLSPPSPFLRLREVIIPYGSFLNVIFNKGIGVSLLTLYSTCIYPRPVQLSYPGIPKPLPPQKKKYNKSKLSSTRRRDVTAVRLCISKDWFCMQLNLSIELGRPILS